MPTGVRQPDATPSAEMDEEDALWHLAAKGAYAVAAGAADAAPRGDYVVRSERPDGPAVLAVVSAAAFLRARCRGWIAADGGRYRLSAAGLKAVREARSRGPRCAPGPRPDPAGRPVAGSAGGGGARSRSGPSSGSGDARTRKVSRLSPSPSLPPASAWPPTIGAPTSCRA